VGDGIACTNAKKQEGRHSGAMRSIEPESITPIRGYGFRACQVAHPGNDKVEFFARPFRSSGNSFLFPLCARELLCAGTQITPGSWLSFGDAGNGRHFRNVAPIAVDGECPASAADEIHDQEGVPVSRSQTSLLVFVLGHRKATDFFLTDWSKARTG
jgi:hypothetical protein